MRNLGISKIERMSIRLFSYNFKIIVAHLKGSVLPADLLTRLYHVPKPSTVRLKDAKQASIVNCPFPVAQIVTVQDIVQALQKSPELVALPAPNTERTVVEVNKLSLSSLSKELEATLSRDQLQKAQNDDPDLRPVVQKLVQGESIPGFALRQGLLYKVRPTNSSLPPGIIVPDALVPSLFAYFHLDVHSGYRILANMIRQNYFVPNLEDRLRKFTSACAICIQHKANTAPKVATGMAPLPTRKCGTWHFDLVTGPSTSRRSRCVFLYLRPLLGVPSRHPVS